MFAMIDSCQRDQALFDNEMNDIGSIFYQLVCCKIHLDRQGILEESNEEDSDHAIEHKKSTKLLKR
jgi:hypothetical protein